ncbi:MAG TPA: RpiB/LacA/LacB family sugar-phosphate isomerase [Candidatus Paceibacterota bacterium]|nr:RpiB/LacA/LacB family sugar-phosphate isomerase [Candidatus Paceibacterota bacterium]
MSVIVQKKKIHLASDHAGFELKQETKTWLLEQGYIVVDHGADSFDETDDFPDFIRLASAAVSLGLEGCVGIIFGGSGQGEAMLANRFSNVRATVFYGGDLEIIKLGRQHNDSNVLSIGARFVTEALAKEAIELWLKTEVGQDEKYQRRNQKIEKITKEMRSL